MKKKAMESNAENGREKPRPRMPSGLFLYYRTLKSHVFCGQSGFGCGFAALRLLRFLAATWVWGEGV
jgi:hypothetical protein